MTSQIFEASREVDAQIMLIGIKFYSMPHLFYLQQFQQFNGGQKLDHKRPVASYGSAFVEGYTWNNRSYFHSTRC